ncbi:hypothetical protein QCA50_004183 [Cerrena zonata]|uniref:F-box domain-containing protein n=1 Tax=Cerrena zonata TaxID=2478898 RepID=A0AAW0GQP9_9APHY
MARVSRFATAPLDIIDEIMSACRDWHVDRVTGEVQNTNEILDLFTRVGMAWTASYICQHWRQAILEIPSVWSQIIIFDCHMAKGRDGLNKLLELVLERSKAAPLTVYINSCEAGAGEFTQETLDKTLRMLSAHLYHTQNLSFILAADTTSIISLASLAPSSLPMLRRLEPYLCIGGSSWHNHHVLSQVKDVKHLFSNAPRLVMASVSFSYPLVTIFQLPWSQIRYLKNSNPSAYAPDILRILPLVPNLSQLHTGHIHNSSAECLPEPTHLLFPSLLDLTISFEDRDSFVRILPLLEVPSLTDLVMSDYFSVDLVRSLITRSRCGPKLRTLHLYCPLKHENLHADGIFSILELTPNVEDLSVSLLENSKGDVLLSLFMGEKEMSSLTIGSPCLLSKLSKLRLLIGGTPEGAIESFLLNAPVRYPSLISVDLYVYDLSYQHRTFEYRR